MESDGERSENGVAIAVGAAVERFLDMLEAAAHRHSVSGKQRQLRRAACKPFQRGEAVLGGDLADRVHSGAKIERRQAGTTLAVLADP